MSVLDKEKVDFFVRACVCVFIYVYVCVCISIKGLLYQALG